VGGDEAGDELLAAYSLARACARARSYFISLLDNSVCGRSWPVGFDVSHGEGGGAADDAGFLVVGLDGQG
jgi:hypothetical protein